MKNRQQMTREELLAEIEFAEAILDGCGADEGLTLWGRIASIKPRLTKRAVDGACACGSDATFTNAGDPVVYCAWCKSPRN